VAGAPEVASLVDILDRAGPKRTSSAVNGPAADGDLVFWDRFSVSSADGQGGVFRMFCYYRVHTIVLHRHDEFDDVLLPAVFTELETMTCAAAPRRIASLQTSVLFKSVQSTTRWFVCRYAALAAFFTHIINAQDRVVKQGTCTDR
jgi:hypothetical protein